MTNVMIIKTMLMHFTKAGKHLSGFDLCLQVEILQPAVGDKRTEDVEEESAAKTLRAFIVIYSGFQTQNGRLIFSGEVSFFSRFSISDLGRSKG